MPGSPVSIGTQVVITPGAAGVPDIGTILLVIPPYIMASGLPLATSGALCIMVNSLSGAPYTLPIGAPASSGVIASGRSLVRMLDRVPTPPGILTILGPSIAPFINDQWPP